MGAPLPATMVGGACEYAGRCAGYSKQRNTAGAVVSPMLANLFLHYVFDGWMRRKHPAIPFERYADDAICHCQSEAQALELRQALEQRFAECKLQLHPQKTKIVYCKDANRSGQYLERSFDFLGYTFRPREAVNRKGERFTAFIPAVSNKAVKKMRCRVRSEEHTSELQSRENLVCP